MSRSFAQWRMLPIVLGCWLMLTSGCGDAASPSRNSLGNAIDTNSLDSRYYWSRNRVATVTLAVNPDTLVIGHTASARAVALNSRGDTLANRSITWSSNDSVVAGVSQTGTVSGVSAGKARIVATIGGVNGSAPVMVTSDSTANPAAGWPVSRS